MSYKDIVKVKGRLLKVLNIIKEKTNGRNIFLTKIGSFFEDEIEEVSDVEEFLYYTHGERNSPSKDDQKS